MNFYKLKDELGLAHARTQTLANMLQARHSVRHMASLPQHGLAESAMAQRKMIFGIVEQLIDKQIENEVHLMLSAYIEEVITK